MTCTPRYDTRTAVEYGVGNAVPNVVGRGGWCLCAPPKVTKQCPPSLGCGGIAPNAPWRP
eukprot:7305816-Prymnesium_polylepis.1